MSDDLNTEQAEPEEAEEETWPSNGNVNSVSQKASKITDAIRCRHAEHADLASIRRLVSCRTLDVFPDAERFGVIYERACLSLVQENDRNEIVAAVFFCNYPNVPAVCKGDWLTWLHKLYAMEKSTETNTLFVHFLVWDDSYAHHFLVELLRATFYAAVLCSYVVLVQPPGIAAADPIAKEMTRIAPRDVQANEEAKNVQTLYVSEESQFVPKMKYRLAVEEDNDDVIAMLDAESGLLRAYYGDYYVSEMMRHPVDSRRLCVSEKEVAVHEVDNNTDTVEEEEDDDCGTSIVGVLGVNRSLDLDTLDDVFELDAFVGLRKIGAGVQQREEKEMSDEGEEDGISSSRSAIDECDDGSRISENETTYRKCDAFGIELLSFASPIDELRCRGLLSAGFGCFPDLDHCAILVPTSRPYFPFLDEFTRVPLKPNRDFPMALYVTHRLTIHGRLRVRRAHPSDYVDASRLLDGMAEAPFVLHDFGETLKAEADEGESYLLLCDNVLLVGLAIVCRETEVAGLRRCYRVEDLVPGGNGNSSSCYTAGRLRSLALLPIFNPRLGLFLAEIARLGDYSVIFHRARLEISVEEDDFRSTDTSSSSLACLNVMQPVEPRIRNWPRFQRFYQKSNPANLFEEPFSLHVFTPRLATISRETVNSKIVVVGASDCGLAFLNALTLGFKYRDLRFADVTLVSTNGLSANDNNSERAEIMIPFRGRHCHAYRCLTPARASYNIVRGTVVAIDRKEQCVRIENSGILTYDYLVIACGLPFQRPEFNSRSESGSSIFDEDNKSNDSPPIDDESPLNCYTINDASEAKYCLEEIERITRGFTIKKSIVFHGCRPECYCALGALLELGLQPAWVTLIESKPVDDGDYDCDDAFADDLEIKNTLRERMLAMGVKVIRDAELLDARIEPDSGLVRYLMLRTKCKSRSNSSSYGDDDEEWEEKEEDEEETFFDCDALISFHVRRPSFEIFNAIEEAGLVFDGRLVIDAEFRTNDRRVFAAGSITKYSRKLKPDEIEASELCSELGIRHLHDSVEAGEKLAEKFVSIATNRDEEKSDELNRWTSLEPRIPGCSYRKPIVTACLLPGGYRYLRVEKPGRKDATRFEPRDEFVWRSCASDVGYFRLRWSEFRTVESITCLRKTDFDIQNIVALYGKHESIINGFSANSSLTDPFEYFSQPWTVALFNDYFDDFRKRCRFTIVKRIIDADRDLSSTSDSCECDCDCTSTSSLEAEAKQSSAAAVTDKLEQVLLDWEIKDYAPPEITDCLIGFIERHEDDELTMYLTARKESRLIGEIEAMTIPYTVDTDGVVDSTEIKSEDVSLLSSSVSSSLTDSCSCSCSCDARD